MVIRVKKEYLRKQTEQVGRAGWQGQVGSSIPSEYCFEGSGSGLIQTRKKHLYFHPKQAETGLDNGDAETRGMFDIRADYGSDGPV